VTAARPEPGLAVKTKRATGQPEGEVFVIDIPFYRTADALGYSVTPLRGWFSSRSERHTLAHGVSRGVRIGQQPAA
jgi:hypothetical protein